MNPTLLIIPFVLVQVLFGPTTSDLILKSDKNDNTSDELHLEVLAYLPKSTVNLTDIQPHLDNLRATLAKYERDMDMLKNRRLQNHPFASSAPSAAMYNTILTSFLTAMTFLCI
ncbi:hypothetical protein GJAV_G00158040 [Gymnothorax javanicus]|nr:hypothetical protein GJAV_G00158040 [Gymnothorax javanicus]